MRSAMVAFVIFLASACVAQTSPLTPQLEKMLIDQSQAVAQAQKAKDADALKRLLSSDFEHVGSEGRLHDREDFIGDAKDGKFTDVMLYSIKVLAVDENAAIVTCDAVVHGTEGDDVIVPHYQHFSYLWVKQEDIWRLRFLQATARRPVD